MCPLFFQKAVSPWKKGSRGLIQFFLCVFTVFWGDLEGAGTLCLPPHSSYIQQPPTIRVNVSRNCNCQVLLRIVNKSLFKITWNCSWDFSHPSLRSWPRIFARFVKFFTLMVLLVSYGILSMMKLYQSSTEFETADSTCSYFSRESLSKSCSYP